jgi:hypothetical protein
MELKKDENGWYLPGNGYSVIIPMEVFDAIHSEEFKTNYPQLTEKIMMQGLDSLNEEETSILARYTG